MFQKLFSTSPWGASSKDVSALILRLASGLLMAVHGWDKFQNFAEKSLDFPDPLHVGMSASLGLTIFAELFCAVLLAVGLGTRLAAIPLIILGVVMVFSVHGSDPIGDKDHPMLYMFNYMAIFLLGAGRFSLDAMFFKK